MEPSCPADAFNIRKRKQFRKKRCRPGKFFFVGEKRRRRRNGEEFCLFFRWGEDREGGTGWCLRTVLLMLQAVIFRGECPIAGTECRTELPEFPLSLSLGCRTCCCAVQSCRGIYTGPM